MAEDLEAIAELERVLEEEARRERIGRKYVNAPLHAKQLALLALPHRVVLYGGAAGGGKTEALLADALQHVDRPRYSALILRRTFRALNLRGSIMDRAKSWIPAEFWHEQDKRFVFPSGATIQFGYCDNDNDLAQYQSAEFHRIYIDELTEWPEGWVTFLMSRMRRIKGDAIPLGFRAGTNPGGVGGEWVRERWGIPEGEVVEQPIETGNRYFLPARAEDNPTLDLAEYELSLGELAGAKYEQLRWGRWVRDGEGFVYSSFTSANLLHVRPDWIAPGKCHALLAQDYGVTNATSFNILAWRDHDPCVYVVESFKLTGLSPSENAERVEALEAQWAFEAMVGDVGGLGKGFVEEARKRFTMPIEPAQKNNKRGYIELFNGELKRRRVLIIAPGCQDLIHELKTLPWAESRVEEAKGFANHCLVAGTQVETLRGPVVIERVMVGDMVMTRLGWRRVSAAWCAGERETWRMGALVGTADHRIATENGWTELSLCRRDTILVAWESSDQASRWSTEASGLGGTRNRPSGPIACTSDLSTGDTCIARCGGPSEGQSHVATRFITATTIRSTTPLTTSNACRPSMSIVARSAAACSSPEPRERLFAGPPVSRSDGETSGRTASSIPVPSAGQSSGQTSMTAGGFVRVHAALATPTGLVERVFDLTVEGAHEFVANGVIVSNCTDGVLYGWRAATNYHEVAEARAPRPGTPEHAQAMAEDLERLAVEAVEREDSEDPWA